jgi:putative ABC transport system permease protein
MLIIIPILQGILERGLIFGLVAISVYLSSRLIKFDNLSIEGAFGLGSALNALLTVYNFNPFNCLLGSLLAGAISGIITGLLNTKLKLNHLISGIIVTTGLFSITLKLAGSNLTVANKPTIFNLMPTFLNSYQTLGLLLILSLILVNLINRFLKTEIGFLLQTVGDAPQMITNIGKSANNYILLGLALSNSFAALSGALFVQYTGYFSIWTNVGILIIGLASMIIAQTISSKFGLSLIIGSITYQAIIAMTFELQLDQSWNKLLTAILIILLILFKQYLDQHHPKEEMRSC